MSAEILEQLRNFPSEASPAFDGITEEKIVDHLREIKEKLRNHGITTEIGMILHGALLHPHDDPIDKIPRDEHYFDRLKEYRNDRRPLITPINFMAAVLYDQKGLLTQPFDDIVAVYIVIADLAHTLRSFYADTTDKRLPEEFY